MHTTLKDISLATGFSINTVSRALKDDTRISLKTRNLIKSKAKEMNYFRNSIASSLRAGSSRTISIIAGDISNPYFSIFIKGVEEYVEKKGYTVIVLNSNEDEHRELKAIQTSFNKMVDGILICPVQKTDDNILYLKSMNVPFTLFGRCFKDIETNYVTPDERKGGYLATKCLIDHGHRNIMFLMANEYISSSSERLAGCRTAFAEAQLDFPHKNVFHFDLSKPDIYNKIIEDRLPYKDVTAIFCFSDIVAQECVFALRTVGKHVPGDISVIGFDDIQTNFKMAISLTSIKITESISSQSAKVLLNSINNKDSNYQQIVLDVEIAHGETVSD